MNDKPERRLQAGRERGSRRVASKGGGRLTPFAARLLRLLLVLSLPGAAFGATAPPPLRVGIYDNPPKVFIDETGRPSGFWPDLTRAMAEREGWRIKWVNGAWSENLERLRRGRIDVMVDVAVNERRRDLFAMGGESVHVSWSRIYTYPASGIETVPDLAARRVGALSDSANLEGPGGFRDLATSFGLAVEIVSFDSYARAFDALNDGRVAAVVSNRDVGARMQSRFDITATPIVFQPVDLRYAFAPDSPRTPSLVAAFDRRLAAFKDDPDSPYHALVDRWLGQGGSALPPEPAIPDWVRWTLFALIALVVAVIAGLYLVELRVRARTRALHEREHELRQHQAMLSASQRIAAVGSWQLDASSDQLTWSEETYRIAGVSPAAFTPTASAFFALIHPDDLERVLAVRASALRGDSSHDVAFRLVRPDGSVRHVHERGEASREAPDDRLVLTGTIQDITERHEAELRLMRYRRLIESSNDLFCIVDADYRLVLANEAYAALYGKAVAAMEGMHLLDLLGERAFAEVKPHIDRCLSGEPRVFETQREHPGHGTRHLMSHLHPLDPPQADAPQVGVVITDVTATRQAERRLHEQAALLAMAERIARMGAWWIDVAGERITWSEMAAEIHGMRGRSPPAVQDAIQQYAPEDRQRLRRLYDNCATRGIPLDEELQLAVPGGERVWVRIVGEPVYDADGRIHRVQGALQDISKRKAADLELERLNKRLGNILDSITDGFFTLDRGWRFDYINGAAERLMKRSQSDLRGRNIWTEFPAAVGGEIERAYRRAVRERTTVSLETYYEPLGSWLNIRTYPTEGGLAVYFLDVTRQRRMAQELRDSRDALAASLETRQMLINALPARIALLDADGNVLDVNHHWREFERENPHAAAGIGGNYLAVCAGAAGHGARDARRVHDGLLDVLRGERETFAMEYPCRNPGGERWFRVTATPLGRSCEGGAVVMHLDITERKQAEHELNRLAFEDPMTGLPSRNGFLQLFERVIERDGWQPNAIVVLLDIEDQHGINNFYGYEIGDRLLNAIGKRLRRELDRKALIARVGGDEFAILLSAAPELAPDRRCQAVVTTLQQPFHIDSASIQINANFGYTELGPEARPIRTLLREAELALYRSRADQTGRRCTPYTRELDDEISSRVRITRELREALDREQLELRFQPKVELATGRPVACEALLRWRHPELGLRSPSMFISIAEQSRLIVPIGNWVLREACRLLRTWRDSGLAIVPISINVSLVEFTTSDFAQDVAAAIADAGIPASLLTLEITESVFVHESEHLLEQLRRLHELGVRLSLDDFGTGYSSLLYLQRYPFDEIKIDQGFVRRMSEDDYSHRIVTTVTALAHALGAEIVAEGVETETLRDALIALGCNVGQGYHYSKPLEVDEFRRLLERRVTLPSWRGHTA